MNANELADLIGMCGDGGYNQDAATMLRQQQNEIEDLINAHRFVQNFAEEQHQRAVALESELDRAVELYTDKAIENEALEKELTEAGGMIGVLREQLQEEIQARADALDDLNNRMMKFMKSYNEMAYKLEEVGGAYTHPVKELTDEVWSKAFDFYCETDEGVLKFDLELRDEWKKEQLIRWKEALKKAQEK
jgi:DNA repair exonuclease SbcCD ATPase subunit